MPPQYWHRAWKKAQFLKLLSGLTCSPSTVALGVDAVIAGLPCQPFSVAGAQRGHDDERAIWPVAFDIIEQVRPALVFLENVPGQLKFFQPVGERLCSMGFRFEAGLFSAEEVGASQKRERFFVLAVSRCNERWRRILGAQAGIGPQKNWFGLSWRSGDVEDTARDVWDGLHRQGGIGRRVRETSDSLANARCVGRRNEATGWKEERRSEYASVDVGNALGARSQERPCNELNDGPQFASIKRAGLPLFAPGPNDPRWPSIIDAYPELAPFLVVDGPTAEEQEAQPALRRLANGLGSALGNRVDQLRIVGNGVVPDTAALAFVTLWERYSRVSLDKDIREE